MTETVQEPTDEAIDNGTDLGNDLWCDLLEFVPGLCEEKRADEVSVAYSLWVNLSRQLVWSGWTFEELSRDLEYHMTDELKDLVKEAGGLN